MKLSSLLSKHFFIPAFIAFIFLLVGTNNHLSASEIVSTHGHAGHIEYQDRILSDEQFKGWGLDFVQDSGLFNWIHYSLSVPFGKQTRFVAVQFQTGSADVSITTIEVFDGEQKIYQESGLNLSGNKQWHVVDMGELKTIDEALGLSIKIGAGVESMSHRIWIFSVAALWEQ